jgi:hypothetical protein
MSGGDWPKIASAFFVGVSFGIIRIVTKGLGTVILIHGLIDALFFIDVRSDGGGHPLGLCWPSAITAIVSVAAFFLHPKLRVDYVDAKPGEPNSKPATGLWPEARAPEAGKEITDPAGL